MTYQVHSSKTISFLIIITHLISLLVLIPLLWPFWVYLLIAALLSASALLTLHKTGALQLPLGRFSHYFDSICQFQWDSNDLWRVWTAAGAEYAVELQAGSAVYSWLVVLNFKTLYDNSDNKENKKFTLLLTEKQLPQHEFRRLRVRLGLQAGRLMADSMD